MACSNSIVRVTWISAPRDGVRGRRADTERSAFLAYPRQLGNATDVDQVRRLGKPELHHREQAVSAGDQLAVVSELREQCERFLDARRAMVFERCRIHGALTSP